MRLRACCVIAIGLASPALQAQTQVVVPNIYTTSEGPGSTAVPIAPTGNAWTLQLIINQNLLTGLVGRDLTGIAYRRSATAGGGYPTQSTTWSPYIIRLGPSVAPNAATGTLANNFTAAPTQVRSGSFTAGVLAWPNGGPPGPNPWGPTIAFDTPYHYTGGDLAMVITHPGSNNPNIGDAPLDTAGSASPGQGTDFSYFASTGFDVGTGSSSVFLPVVRFTAVAPVPEPATGLLVGSGAMAIGAAIRAIRRHGRPTAAVG
jgi:hypothetical protein